MPGLAPESILIDFGASLDLRLSIFIIGFATVNSGAAFVPRRADMWPPALPHGM